MNNQILEEKNKKIVRDFIEQNNIKLPKNKRKFNKTSIVYTILVIFIITVNLYLDIPKIKNPIPEKFVIEKIIEKEESYLHKDKSKYRYEILVKKANDKNNKIYKGRTNYHKLGKIKEKQIIYGKIYSEEVFFEESLFPHTLVNTLMPNILLLILIIFIDVMALTENGHRYDKQLKKKIDPSYLNNLKISKEIAMTKASYETNKTNKFYISIFVFMFIIFLIICIIKPILINFIAFSLVLIITFIIRIYAYSKEEKKLSKYRNLEMGECIESVAIDYTCYMETNIYNDSLDVKWYPSVTVFVDNKIFRVQCTIQTYICILYDPHVYIIKYMQNGVLKNVKVFSIYDYS